MLRRTLTALAAGLLLHAAAGAATPRETALAQLAATGIAPQAASLAQYAALGDAATVALLIDAGVAVDALEPVRRVSALHNAAAQGHVKLATRLLDLGARPDLPDWNGATALISAACAGHRKVVELLLQRGSAPNVVPARAPTALICAIEHGDPALVDALLKGGALADLADAFGRTPLTAATMAGRSALAARLGLPATAVAEAAPALQPAPAPAPAQRAPVALKAAAPSQEPVLDYPDRELALAGAAQLAAPQSVFHAWATAQAEADKIIGAWASEPVTLPWTRLQLAGYVKHKMMPTRGARGLALVHVAMHDAYLLARRFKVDQRLAVSMAAAQVLGYLHVPEEKAFDRIAFALAARLTGASADALPLDARRALYLGQLVGQRVARHGDADGAQKGWNGIRLQWYGEGRYYGPGSWAATPPYFYFPPDEPFAHGWKTWVLSSGAEFRPTPPAYGSPRYMADLREVLSLAASGKAEQIAVAKFWVDGHGSVTPPGHWNQIAIDLVLKAKPGDAETARLFAQLNIAVADTFIAVWDTKYHYWTARPVSAARSLLGQEFKPAILTPPFPSYVSGHAAFSGAAATVLGAHFPEAGAELERMAQEAAMSRLYGGIHFRHDNEDGLVLGRKVGAKVLARFWGPAR